MLEDYMDFLNDFDISETNFNQNNILNFKNSKMKELHHWTYLSRFAIVGRRRYSRTSEIS